MALIPTSLQSALINIFVSTMTDSSFSTGLASGINSYCGTGQITAATLGGTVSAGTFTGFGSGTMVVNIASSDIGGVCNAMKSNPSQNPDGSWDPGLGKGDDYLAEQLASIIDAACTEAEFTVLISGTAVAGQVTTTFTEVPTTDVTWQGDADALETSLLNSMTSTMSDATFARAIGDAVTTYLTSAQITVRGEDALLGASGSAIMA